MRDFTPWAALAGGILIGAGASLLLIFTGRLAGISGILGNLLLGARGDRSWRALFLGGLLAAGLVFALLAPETFSASPRSLPLVAMAGLLVGVGTLLFDGGVIGPTSWMTLVGLGLYLGYVPYGCVLFDRTIAALGIVATAVFLIYVSDAVAYGGSVVVVLYKNLGQADISKLQFFRYFSYATSAFCVVSLAIGARYFLRRARSRP